MGEQKPAALVTGGAVRLGRAIAIGLAERGFDIALHYNRSQSDAHDTARSIREVGSDCESFPGDLSKSGELENFISNVKERFPNLEVLINSASGYTQATISDTTIEDFDALFAVNLRAPFFLSRAFAKIVNQGNVINILDNKIGFNQTNYAAYLLTKKSLAQFTRLAAIEFAPNIRVNGVAPGVVLPADSRTKEYIEWRLSGIPLKKQGQIGNIIGAVQFLLENDFITGQILTVDGGENIAHLGQNAGDYDPTKV